MSHQEETTCKHSCQWQRDILSNIIKFKCKRLAWLAVALSINTPHFYLWPVQKIMGHALIVQTSLSHKKKPSEKIPYIKHQRLWVEHVFSFGKAIRNLSLASCVLYLLWEGSTLISISAIALRIRKSSILHVILH